MRVSRVGTSACPALCRALMLLTTAALMAAVPGVAEGFPASVKYDGQLAASDVADGSHDFTFHYFDLDGAALYAESMRSVTVVDGKFSVDLGTGEVGSGELSPGERSADLGFESLQAVFALHPELEFEVRIDGTVLEPRVGLLPGGHSLKSRLVAAGVRSQDDGDEHWRRYTTPNRNTSIQSGVLAPVGSGKSEAAFDANLRRRPYTLPIVGPVLSRPVRELAPAERRALKEEAEINPPRHESLFDKDGIRFGTAAPKQDDPLAGPANQTARRTPALSVSFEGLGNVTGVLPPDTEGAVGPNHYVQVVNSVFAVFDKAGTQLTSTANTNTLWAGFGGPCQTDNSGDAIFLYDQAADRFVLSQFAVSGSNQSVCFAVSQTPNPTGSYYLYEVVTPRFPDYYKVGVWPDASNNAYFFGTNSGFQGQYDVFAIDRANMLTGATARPMQFFQNFVNLMMPADVDGPTGPPSGSPGVFYTFRDGGESYFSNPPTDSIDVWEFDVDWNTPANSTFALVNSITPAQGLADFNWTVCGFFVSNCIPQPGTGQGIDSASWWPMQRLVYRNFGSHETLVGAWTVDVLAAGNRAAPRWFELRDSGGGWTMYQQGTHSPDAIHRWMPSIAMDGSGNIGLGYSRGDGSNFASIYYATRDAGDPLGTLQSEALLIAATGAQTHSAARWGDYSSMELDPADDCTFWYTTEYLTTTGSAPWRTRVGAFTVPGCGGPPVPSFNISCSPSMLSIQQNDSGVSTCTVTSVNGYTGSVDLSCNEALADVSCSFAPSTVSPTANSTLTITVGASAATGSFSFDVEGDDGSVVEATGINLTVTPEGSNGPQIATFDGARQAPSCLIPGSSCDSTTLVDGRANLGPEPNQPNTIADSCADGTSGTYHNDESNDRILVSTLDGGNFTEGDTVQIEATVYAWNTGSADTLDLYYAADATSPSWVFIGSIGTPSGGSQTLSAQYVLPTGTLQAVRAQFRYQGSASSCTVGNYNDRDDLVFAVESATSNDTPVVTITSPADGSSSTVGDSVSIAGTAIDTEDGDISASLAWTSSIDGSIGSGASFSTTGLSVGAHTITASVTDSGGASGSDDISITVNAAPNTPPTVTVTAPANGSSSTAGDNVSFAGTATDAEDGTISGSLSWSSSIDGVIGSGASFSTTGLSVGVHTVTASVTDSGGLSDSDNISITVNAAPNTPPTVTITAPADGSSFVQFSNITFSGTATDAEDGTISASLSWTSSIDGAIGSGASFSTTALAQGVHTITAAVTDSGGLSDSDVITVAITAPPAGSALWMSFRSNTAVPGVGTVADEDIVSYDETTGTWTYRFDGSDVGLGSLEISGLAVLPDGDLLLSFTAAGTVGGLAVDDSDIVRFTGTGGPNTSGSFSLYFDGSDVGLTSNGEDVDAIAVAADGRLIISTLGSASMNGASGRDEDLFIFTGTLGASTSGNFALHFDGSDVALNNSGGEDVDAAALTAGGDLLFSTVGTFTSGVTGQDEDVAQFVGTFGSATSGTISIRQDLTALGINSNEDIGSLHIVE